MDKKADPKCTLEHEGRVIAFCCAKCRARFKADPASYLAKLPPADKTASTPINQTCPVTGEAADPKHTSLHEGRLIAFCCAKCKAAFDKNPTKFAAKLPKK